MTWWAVNYRMSNIPSEVNHTTSFSARQPVGVLCFTLLCLHTHTTMKHTAWKLKGFWCQLQTFCTITVVKIAHFNLSERSDHYLVRGGSVKPFFCPEKKKKKTEWIKCLIYAQAKVLHTDAINYLLCLINLSLIQVKYDLWHKGKVCIRNREVHTHTRQKSDSSPAESLDKYLDTLDEAAFSSPTTYSA